MKKLNFIVNWGNNKKNAWSGVNYNIYCELQKYFDVHEYQTSEDYHPKSNGLVHRIIAKIFKIRREVGFDKDFDVTRIRFNRRHLRKLNGLVFQFDEILQDTPSRQTFIYQDFCVEFLDYLRKNDPKTLGRSGFRFIPTSAVQRRNKMQLEYYNKCTAIFCMGKWLVEFLSTHHPEWRDKIFYAGAGVNLDQSKINPNPHKTHNKILYVGRDYKLKGGQDTIEAFIKLKSKRPDLELHFCGPKKNPVVGKLDGYYYYGNASHEQLHDLMNNCDLFCMPSHMEGFGIATIEALMFGLPCLGRNAYEMPYLIKAGETGELVDSESVDEMAEKMDKILSNPKYAENVIANRDFYQKEYSWDSVAKRMAEVILNKVPD